MPSRKIGPLAAALALLFGSAMLTSTVAQSWTRGANPGPKPADAAPTTKGEARAGATTK